MTTPTNHTHSSLFDFGDLMEPEPSQSSLEQNSSIEESQIFVSVGGDASGHTRFSSSALSGASGLKSRNGAVRSSSNNNNNNNCDSVLGPVEEEPETPLSAEDAAVLTPPPPPPLPPPPPKAHKSSNSILKPSSYSNTKQQQQQQQQRQQHRRSKEQQKENLALNTHAESGASATYGGNGGSVLSAHPFSPTVHTSNQRSATFKQQDGSHHPFSPTLRRSNQAPAGFKQHDDGSSHALRPASSPALSLASSPALSPTSSPTLNASNPTPSGSGRQMIDNAFEEPTTHVQTQNTTTEDDHGAERATAWAIHLALIFFCVLVVACSLLTFSVIHTYGFFTLFLMTIVIAFCGFFACFVDTTILSENPKLKPVRQKIRMAVEATRKMIEDECKLFLRDWREEVLMITDGREYDDSNGKGTRLDGETETSAGAMLPQRRRKKSKVFKLVRPFLGIRKKLFKGKHRKQKARNQTAPSFDEMPSYNPPVVGMVV